ncbi:MAG: putative secreted protein [Rhodospirillales bacterium]|nr:putative secreted protein [Rhodospirillales bacterium]
MKSRPSPAGDRTVAGRGAACMLPVMRAIPLLLLILGACATETPPRPPLTAPVPNAKIDQVAFGGVIDWKAEGEQAILLRSRNGRTFRATFFAPCLGLPYAQQIGVVPRSLGEVDKFASIIADGRQCRFRDFTEIPPPASW